MNNIIAILDKDIFFAKKLCQSLNKCLDGKFIFYPFNDIKSYLEFEKDNIISIIIFSSDFKYDILDLKCQTIIQLNEIKEDDFVLYNNENINFDNAKKILQNKKIIKMYKFQTANILAKKINLIIDAKNCSNNVQLIKNSIKKISLFNPSLNYKYKKLFYDKAKETAKESSTLFIDINEFSFSNANVGLSNIIFFYKSNELDNEKILSQVIKDSMLNVIHGVNYPDDLSVINSADLDDIVSILCEQLKIDYLFLSLDNSFIRNQILLAKSNKIFIPAAINKEEQFIISNFVRYIRKTNYFDINNLKEIDNGEIVI